MRKEGGVQSPRPVLPYFFFLLARGSTGGFGTLACAGVEPMRVSVVPHTPQVPFVMAEPVLEYVACGLFISRFSRHLTQYAWITSLIKKPFYWVKDD